MAIFAHPDCCVQAEDLIGLRSRAVAFGQTRSRRRLAGVHSSRYRGRGMDYRESRHYQSGDDIRTMDWRITARTGHPHVKLFDEERERPIVVLVDFSPTLFFASRGAFKSVQAARLAALIGWSAIAHSDRIGALLFHGDVHRELPPAGGRRGQLRLIRALVEAGEPERGLAATAHPGALIQALARLRRVARPGSWVFLLSDFYNLTPDASHHLLRLGQHCTVTAVQLVDALELQPPPPGRYGVCNQARSGLIDTRLPAQRRHYQQHFQRQHQQIYHLLHQAGAALWQLRTDEDVATRLAAWLREGSA